MRVEVSYSPAPGQVDHSAVELPDGSTLAQAVAASGLLVRHPSLGAQVLDGGVWGRRQPPDTMLRDRDRVEIYRPLTVDPKEARRLRFNGSRTASRRGRAAPRRRVGRRREIPSRPGR